MTGGCANVTTGSAMGCQRRAWKEDGRKRSARLRPPVAATDQPIADRAEGVDRAEDPPEDFTPANQPCRSLADVSPRPSRDEDVPDQEEHDPVGLALHG